MTLTPHDVEIVEFPRRIFGGICPDAVDEFLEEVVTTLILHIEEKGKLEEQIERLTSELESYHAKEKLVTESVTLAQQTRDQVISIAKKEAESIIKEARLEEVRLRNELAGLKAERDAFEYEFYGLLKGFLMKIEKTHPNLAQSDSSPGTNMAAQIRHDLSDAGEQDGN